MFHSSPQVKLPSLGRETFLVTGSVLVFYYLAAFLSNYLGRAQFCLIPSNFVCFLSEVTCAGSLAHLCPSPWTVETDFERDFERDGCEISRVDPSDRRTGRAPRLSREASTGV